MSRVNDRDRAKGQGLLSRLSDEQRRRLREEWGLQENPTLLGCGAYACAWLAESASGELVVVKIIGEDEEAAAALEILFRSRQRENSPLVRVYWFGEIEPRLWVAVTEYLEPIHSFGPDELGWDHRGIMHRRTVAVRRALRRLGLSPDVEMHLDNWGLRDPSDPESLVLLDLGQSGAGFRAAPQRLNPDSDFREAERRGDRARLLAGRLRRGQVSVEHLAVAGWLGDKAAAQVVPPWAPPYKTPTGSWPALHALEYAAMEPTARVQAAALIVAHALPTFENQRPDDRRPREAVLAALRWTADPSDENARAADAATHGCYDAARDVRDSYWPWIGLKEARVAGAAASVASAAAAPVESVRINAVRGAVRAINDNLEFEVRSDKDDEHESQRRILVAVMTGDPLDEFWP